MSKFLHLLIITIRLHLRDNGPNCQALFTINLVCISTAVALIVGCNGLELPRTMSNVHHPENNQPRVKTNHWITWPT